MSNQIEIKALNIEEQKPKSKKVDPETAYACLGGKGHAKNMKRPLRGNRDTVVRVGEKHEKIFARKKSL